MDTFATTASQSKKREKREKEMITIEKVCDEELSGDSENSGTTSIADEEFHDWFIHYSYALKRKGKK